MAFWTIYNMRAKEEQERDEPQIIYSCLF